MNDQAPATQAPATLAHASEVMSDAQRLVAQATAEVQAAYQRVFDGTPSRDDQALVLRDLEKFCGMRTDLMRGTDRDTANAAGKFRVWQRIHAFRYPLERRPTDATQEGERHGRHPDQRPIASGGVAEPTVD